MTQLTEASTVTPTPTDQRQRPTAASAPTPDASCGRHDWCVTTGSHDDCYGPEIGLPSPEGPDLTVLTGQLHYDAEDDATVLLYQRCADDWNRITAAQLRDEAIAARAHADALDALADQYDTIRAA